MSFKKIYDFVRHNFGVCMGIPLCSLFLLYAYSCESNVVSIINPNIKITRGQLLVEVDSFLAQAEMKFDDLDRQDLVRDTLFNGLTELAAGGTINPAGILLTLGNILGIGAVIDNVRKRTYIATVKSALKKVEQKV